jgi:hypothetical protein
LGLISTRWHGISPVPEKQSSRINESLSEFVSAALLPVTQIRVMPTHAAQPGLIGYPFL